MTDNIAKSDAEALRQTLAMLGVAPPPPRAFSRDVTDEQWSDMTEPEREAWCVEYSDEPTYKEARAKRHAAELLKREPPTLEQLQTAAESAAEAFHAAKETGDWETIHEARKLMVTTARDLSDREGAQQHYSELIARVEYARAYRRLEAEHPLPTMPTVAEPTKRGFVFASDLPRLFSGFVYVQDVHMMATPDGTMLSQAQFDADERFAGRKYPLMADGSKSTDSAWEAFIDSQIAVFPQVRGTIFDPREQAGAILRRDGFKFVNVWRALDIVATPGDVTPFLNHLKLILPNGDDCLILLSYLAALIQYLGEKAAWAIFLQGVEGNGKSFFVKLMEYCLGASYVHNAAADDLGNNFNGAFYGKLLVAVDEVQVNEGREALWNKLKSMITDARQEITFKRVDKVTRSLCCNFLFNSNHKDGLRKTPNDRRICPLYTAQQSVGDLIRDGMDEPYFIRLFDWLNKAGGAAHVLHYLREFEIPERYDFTRGARRAPATSSTAEAMQAGLGSVEQEILAAVAEGRTGFKGGWISSRALDVLLNETRKAGSITRNKRAEILRGLGYAPHPVLPRGQVNNALSNGQGRPYLYVTSDHTSINASAAQVAAMFEAAQAQP